MEWIFLYGPPGSGKSALGRQLAEALQLPFSDLDEVIQRQAGRTVVEIFAAEGETGFRQRERVALEETLLAERGVVALGGGALLEEVNRQRVLAAGKVLRLEAQPQVLMERLQGDPRPRPLLGDHLGRGLQQLLGKRAAHYAAFPLALDTSGAPLDELCEKAQVLLGMFHLSGMGKGYDVRVAAGSLDRLGEALATRRLREPVAIVSDAHVRRYYGEAVLNALRKAGLRAELVVLPAGERHKNLASLRCLWRRFLRLGLDRSSTVVALGGGVVGDLAGFAAATYLRGVVWVVAPTSLLAMVDASLGGKTGVDLRRGKNLVGAFYPPRLVLTDPTLLRTLPEVELRNGLAEVVKHALIGDPDLFARCQGGWGILGHDWEAVVRQAMAVKVRILREDPYEQGARAKLNLGHTVGHGLEKATGYRLRHGEAVSIGMVAAACLAEKLGLAKPGLTETLRATLGGLGLPTSPPRNLSRRRLLRAMGVDKKRAAGEVRFVLPCAVGEVCWGVVVEDWQNRILEVLTDDSHLGVTRPKFEPFG